MDQKLRKRLILIDQQIERLYEAEMKYLSLDAAKEHTLAAIMLGTDGTSDAERKMKAWASNEWSVFKEGLASAEAAYHKEKHRLTLMEKSFDATFLSLKIEAPIIRRQGAVT